MILFVVPARFGITTFSAPSLAVPESKVVEKVNPPSVDNTISTLAQFTPFAVVPATFQVMLCVLPPE